MKKILFLLFLCIGLCLVGCSNGENIKKQGVLTKTIECERGETFQIDYNIKEDVLFEIEDTSIASVSETGLITGLIPGSTKVNVKYGENIVIIDVRIKGVLDESIEITSDYNTVYTGKEFLIEYKSEKKYEEIELNWSSSDTLVATVENGLVKTRNPGKTIIRVESIYNVLLFDEIEIEVEKYSFKISAVDDILHVGDNLDLTYTMKPVNDDKELAWTSSNEKVIKVKDGKVECVGSGISTIIVCLADNSDMKGAINLKVYDNYSLEITSPTTVYELASTVKFNVKITPETTKQITWKSLDSTKAVYTPEGFNFLDVGEVQIEACLTEDETVKASFQIEITVDPEKVLNSFHIENPYVKQITTYGNTERKQTVYGSVNKLFFSDTNIIEKIVPITQSEYVGQIATKEMLAKAEAMKLVRSGIIHPELKYIIYHDTGNNNEGTGALNHANFMVGDWNLNENRGRSWHYTVDDDCVYHHIPDNEVTWQGDSYDSYSSSIGIETCVDFGSDLETTWHRTAKLMASLLVKYNLGVDAVKQHYDMSKKNCPQTLRRNNMYDYAIDMIEAEYIVLKALKDYKIEFTSLNLNYVDSRGRVIALPDTETQIQYKLKITNNAGYNKELMFTSTLQAK